jgi:hypothetical protein
MKKASLRFHIEKNDFFGTLATVLDLLFAETGLLMCLPEKCR